MIQKKQPPPHQRTLNGEGFFFRVSVIRINLIHHYPSSFPVALFFLLSLFSISLNLYFVVSFEVKVVFVCMMQ